MKLFNWMHRRFHHTSLKDGVSKDEELKSEKQSMAGLDVFDGILTIGTLGFDPMKPFVQHNEYLILQEEVEDIGSIDVQQEHESYSVDTDNESVNEVEPLILTRFEHNYEIMEINSSEFDVPRKEKGERITLAELFMEDSEIKKKQQDFGEFIETNKIAKKPSKNGLSFKNKLIPSFKDDSRPIKKIHQMVKRMLKRKIHPEVEGSKSDNAEVDIIDSVSLLPNSTGPAI